MFKSPLTLFDRRYHFRQHQHQYTCVYCCRRSPTTTLPLSPPRHHLRSSPPLPSSSLSLPSPPTTSPFNDYQLTLIVIHVVFELYSFQFLLENVIFVKEEQEVRFVQVVVVGHLVKRL